MCRAWVGVLAAAWVAATPAPAAGQDLVARLDSLEADWQALREAGADSEGNLEGWSRETVDGLVVLSRLEESAVMGPAVETAAGELPLWTHDGGLEGLTVVFASRGRPVPETGGEAVVVRPSLWTATVEARVAKGLSLAMDRALSQSVGAWIWGHAISDAVDKQEVYRALAASGLEVGRRCFLGVLSDCGLALGLSRVPATNAYNDWELSRAAASAGRGGRWREDARRRCAERVDPGACRSWVDGMRNPGSTLRPLPHSVRHSLMTTALELGGTGALRRMGESAETAGGFAIRDQIEAAAEMPVEDVLAEWHRRYGSLPPRSAALSLPILMASACWMGLFAFFTSRSSRWRIG